MAKDPAKTKAESRLEKDLDKYAENAAPKRDGKVVFFAILALIVFGLMAAFLLTTNQNVDSAPPAAPGQTAPGR